MRELNSGKTPVHGPSISREPWTRWEVEAAIQFVDTFEGEHHWASATNIFTQEGGTYLAGFKTKFTALINSYTLRRKSAF